MWFGAAFLVASNAWASGIGHVDFTVEDETLIVAASVEGTDPGPVKAELLLEKQDASGSAIIRQTRDIETRAGAFEAFGQIKTSIRAPGSVHVTLILRNENGIIHSHDSVFDYPDDKE
ncbi:hypothetical protein [Cognatishimia sp. F0-27]|uniref:hypothetical protein n=1 Tax=Cognatishimia sp. F0-27 TaxID=2816855 RepID=UPI001D0C2E3D|nr:hypothetical protein [Cognatishimia sp. F0-27]MCC1494651.1 hypothetical protein [Cognatishimia sp. F0-27]